jgi:hypothetical protein
MVIQQQESSIRTPVPFSWHESMSLAGQNGERRYPCPKADPAPIKKFGEKRITVDFAQRINM